MEQYADLHDEPSKRSIQPDLAAQKDKWNSTTKVANFMDKKGLLT